MTYVIVSVLLAVVAALAYSQGRINGINIGRMEVLEEDLIRSGVVENRMIDEAALVDRLVGDVPTRYGTVVD